MKEEYRITFHIHNNKGRQFLMLNGTLSIINRIKLAWQILRGFNYFPFGLEGYQEEESLERSNIPKDLTRREKDV